MFGASKEVVSFAVVTRAQSVSRATLPTTQESVESLRARNSDPADQMGDLAM
jgi:hypothetical protein